MPQAAGQMRNRRRRGDNADCARRMGLSRPGWEHAPAGLFPRHMDRARGVPAAH